MGAAAVACLCVRQNLSGWNKSTILEKGIVSQGSAPSPRSARLTGTLEPNRSMNLCMAKTFFAWRCFFESADPSLMVMVLPLMSAVVANCSPSVRGLEALPTRFGSAVDPLAPSSLLKVLHSASCEMRQLSRTLPHPVHAVVPSREGFATAVPSGHLLHSGSRSALRKSASCAGVMRGGWCEARMCETRVYV